MINVISRGRPRRFPSGPTLLMQQKVLGERSLLQEEELFSTRGGDPTISSVNVIFKLDWSTGTFKSFRDELLFSAYQEFMRYFRVYGETAYYIATVEVKLNYRRRKDIEPPRLMSTRYTRDPEVAVFGPGVAHPGNYLTDLFDTIEDFPRQYRLKPLPYRVRKLTLHIREKLR